MSGSVDAVDAYYTTHPLLELPPEESVLVPSEDERMETPETIPPPPSIEPVIHMCRSVNKYRKIARLNEGSYGIVYKAQNIETDEVIALKRVGVVVRCYVYMVMDYIPYELGRVLHTIKADLTASEVKTLLYQLLSGLAYMHRKWYFHR